MSNRTVMAGRIGPASLREGSRSVYICAPGKNGPDHQELINAVLEKVIRHSDRLLYINGNASADPVIAFAERYGLFTDQLMTNSSRPDLIVAIVDPLGDNAHATRARTLAKQKRSDLFITELPAFIE